MAVSFRGPLTWLEGVVRNRPVHARIEQTEFRTGLFGRRARRRLAQGSLWRDSEGRLRYEYEMAQGVMAVSIVDPVSSRILTLDPQRQLYYSNEIQYRLVEAKLPEQASTAQEERLEGMDCRRITRVLPDGTTVESWVSVDLLIVVKEHVTRGGVETVWGLKHIARGSPEPSLFLIPRRYLRADDNNG